MADGTPSQPQDCNSSDPGKQILCFLQSPFASQLQASSIGVAVGYSLGITAVTVLYFSLIRPRHHIVYEPKVKYADKKHCPPPLGNGFFDWIKPIMNTKEDVIIEKVGLDAAIFLRFTRMLRNIFIVLAILGCSILIPVHVTQSQIFPTGQTPDISTYVRWMTPQDVQPPVMWAHVVMAYVFNIIVLCFIWWNFRAVARIRKNYFLSKEYQHSLHSRSVWMVDIPPQLRSDEGILQIVDSVEHTAGIPRAAIARNVKDLPELIEEHTETVKKLESVLAKYLKDPDKLPPQRPTLRPSKRDHRVDHSARIDAIDYLTKRIKELEMEIKDVRESIDKRNAMSYGFATYDRIEEAHIVAYAARKKHPKGTSIKLAPKPNDFIWKNMPLGKKTRARKRFVANLWVALLTVVWIVPNAFIAIFLVNLSNIGALSSSFNQSFESNRGLWSVIQAILGPTLLSTFYLCLPILFRRLSMRAGDLTKTSRERHVTHKLYAFFIFNNLIVFSVFSTMWGFISTVISSASTTGSDVWSAIEASNFSKGLLISLCQVSVFWITWLLQRNLTAAIDLSQIAQLFWVWFSKTFLAPTPRQKITWTAPPPFDYAQYFNYYLFYATVSLSNSMLQPVVLVCAVILFSIEAFLKKYLLLYVYITKTESGGLFWNVLVNRLLFGLGVSHVVGALVIKGVENPADPWTTYTQLFCLVPLWFIILGFKWYTLKNFAPQCKYYIKAIPPSLEAPADQNKKRRNERIGVKFGHPALYKPLICPMVAAKAQHILPMLIADQDSYELAQGYGNSVAMGPMSESQPGARGLSVSGGATDMFEVVPEANMDFAYFKNRADFGDEHGGGGELYGRAMDLVSERSGTPASFLTQDSDDGHSVTGTPPPMPIRQQRPEELMNHPAFRGSSLRGQSPLGQGAMYGHQRNESQSRLLPGHSGSVRGYEPVSREPSYGHDVYSDHSAPPQLPATIPQTYDSGAYGMERWRTGGSGYVGVHAHTDDDTGYESYRAHARTDSGPHSPTGAHHYGSQPPTPGGYMPYNQQYRRY